MSFRFPGALEPNGRHRKVVRGGAYDPNMGSCAAEEQKLVLAWSIMRTTAGNHARDLRVDGLTAHACEQILDAAIAIEKSIAAVKLLVADRAAEGSGWRTRGARSAEEDLARRSG